MRKTSQISGHNINVILDLTCYENADNNDTSVILQRHNKSGDRAVQRYSILPNFL